MTIINVGLIIGSVSSTSINRRLARALTVLAPRADLRLTEIPIRDLPIYSADNDGAIPERAAEFKRAVEEFDAIVIVTPEYNRSVPGVLKNALDTASRPWGDNSFDAKPTAVIGMSIGAIGTAVAQQQLRSILGFLAAPVLAQPEAYLQSHEGLISDDGVVNDERTTQFLVSWLTAARAHFDRARVLAPV